MKDPIRIVSTKKLSEKQKQLLTDRNFMVYEEDFISIKYKSFELDSLNDFLIFTSQNAVESVLRNIKVTAIKAKQCFCVGENTKALLEEHHFEVIEYSEYAAELASLICNQYSKNSFTFFCGTIRREVLPDALRLASIKLEEITVYETLKTPHKIPFTPNGILFFSPSAAVSYLQEHKIDQEMCFCIGNTTAEALKDITPNILIANQPNIENTLMKCIEYYK